MSNKSKFKPKTRRYELVWPDDHDLAGLVVTMRAMRMGELEKLGTLSEEFDAVGEDPEDGNNSKRVGLLSDMMDRVGKVLIHWNRPDEDTMSWNEETEEFEWNEETQLLPVGAEGLRQLEDWEFMEILQGYLRNAVGVSPDLGKDSASGQQSLAQLPMTAP